VRINCEQAEIESDFQKRCRKGAKFAAHTTFWAILGEISCLFSVGVGVFHPVLRENDIAGEKPKNQQHTDRRFTMGVQEEQACSIVT
jgi:hypothetical protein